MPVSYTHLDVYKRQVFMTHLARTLHPSHDVLVARMEPPFIVAYDGLDCALERIPTYR